MSHQEENEVVSETSRSSEFPKFGDGVLPPLQEWIDKDYKGLKKDFHKVRGKIIESQPEREPYMPYCFNSLLAYTNTDVPHYAFYKRYDENPAAYCQRRTAIGLTEPEVSWKMDNVLFLTDYEMYYKPYSSDTEEGDEEDDEEGEEEEEEGSQEGEDGEEEGEDGEKKKKKDKIKKTKKTLKQKIKEKAEDKMEEKHKSKKSNKKSQQSSEDKQKKTKSDKKPKKEDGGTGEQEGGGGAAHEGEDQEGEGEDQSQQPQKNSPEEAEKERKEKLRKEREEIQYRKAKEIWVTHSFDYIFEKPEKKQDSLLAAIRTNKKYLKDIKQSVWERLIGDRRGAYEKMVRWREEQEYALKHGSSRKKTTTTTSDNREGDHEGEGDPAHSKEEEENDIHTD